MLTVIAVRSICSADTPLGRFRPCLKSNPSLELAGCAVGVGSIRKGKILTRDTKLHRYILDELEFDPSIVSANIGVAVDDGIVSLTGRVYSVAEKMAAEAAVKRVKGVRGIAEEITVVLPEAHMRGDEDLCRQALCMIEWDTSLPMEGILVAVENGWVTLSGDIDSYFQGQSAQKAVQKLMGVKGVTNRINIRAEAMPQDISDHIKGVFERRDIRDPDTIQVMAYGGKVTLEGRVGSLYERRLAERAAWSAVGVTYVDNRLTVVDAEAKPVITKAGQKTSA